MNKFFSYWLDTDIIATDEGILLSESTGQALNTICIRQIPHVRPRAGHPPIPVSRIVAEAYLGRPLGPDDRIVYIHGKDPAPGNLIVSRSFLPAPVALFDDGVRRDFEDSYELIKYLCSVTPADIRTLRAGLHNVFIGRALKVCGYPILLAEDVSEGPAPWTRRPIDKLDYNREVMQTFTGIDDLVSRLGLPANIGRAPIRRHVRGILAKGSGSPDRIFGHKLAYRSEHVRRIYLKHKK